MTKVDLTGGKVLEWRADGTAVIRFVDGDKIRDVTVDDEGNFVSEKNWLKAPPDDPRVAGPRANEEKRPI